MRPGSATTVKWIAWLCVALSGWSARDLLADTPAPGNASGWTAAVQRPTYWAHDFVDSVGTVIHLLHPDSFYGSQFEVMKQKLLAAHIMHVRDGAMDAHGGFFNGDQATRFQELGRAGIRVTFITRLNVSREFVQGFPARVSPAFEAYELPNELNIAHGVPWPTMTGVPAASASSTTCPKFSPRVGSTSRSTLLKTFWISRRALARSRSALA